MKDKLFSGLLCAFLLPIAVIVMITVGFFLLAPIVFIIELIINLAQASSVAFHITTSIAIVLAIVGGIIGHKTP